MYKYDVHPFGKFPIGTSGVSQKTWSLPEVSHADVPRTETIILNLVVITITKLGYLIVKQKYNDGARNFKFLLNINYTRCTNLPKN